MSLVLVEKMLLNPTLWHLSASLMAFEYVVWPRLADENVFHGIFTFLRFVRSSNSAHYSYALSINFYTLTIIDYYFSVDLNIFKIVFYGFLCYVCECVRMVYAGIRMSPYVHTCSHIAASLFPPCVLKCV